MNSAGFLEKLLDGAEVEWKRLGDVVRIKNGKDHKTLGEGKFPVYGSGGIMRYADTYAYNKPSVLIPRKGSLGNLFFVDVPFWTVDTIFYTEIDEAQVCPKYLYYFLTTVGLGEMNQAGGVPSQTQSVLNELKIPIPCPENPKKSLAIQAEIVRILDSFTELTAELTARKKQYSYYRDMLLSFDLSADRQEGEEACLSSRQVEWKTLGEVATIGTGSHDTQDAIVDGEYIFYARGREPLRLNEFDFDETAIITAGDGAGVGKVFHYAQGKYALHQRAYRIVPGTAMSPRFVYHCIKSHFYAYIQKASVSSSVTSLRRPMFLDFPIPVPSLTEQERIVAILDKFDALTNSITEGLPREIELRQKQYEYYRDMLLSFPRPTKKP